MLHAVSIIIVVLLKDDDIVADATSISSDAMTLS
jgi:hypothetical protein